MYMYMYNSGAEHLPSFDRKHQKLGFREGSTKRMQAMLIPTQASVMYLNRESVCEVESGKLRAQMRLGSARRRASARHSLQHSHVRTTNTQESATGCYPRSSKHERMLATHTRHETAHNSLGLEDWNGAPARHEGGVARHPRQRKDGEHDEDRHLGEPATRSSKQVKQKYELD